MSGLSVRLQAKRYTDIEFMEKNQRWKDVKTGIRERKHWPCAAVQHLRNQQIYNKQTKQTHKHRQLEVVFNQQRTKKRLALLVRGFRLSIMCLHFEKAQFFPATLTCENRYKKKKQV